MPKTREDCSDFFERSRRSPLRSSSSVKDEHVKEWEDVRCPVCMEHPHNAVLLICSSYYKGCRPYMCDTSYRHSNCLDQFRKSSTTASSEEQGERNPRIESSSEVTPRDDGISRETPVSELVSAKHKLQHKLVCPLCRGQISGWVVVDSARSFMNSKSRSCACETCEFTGTYADLRKHARSKHPQVRPAEVDPERQRSWRHLERQRDYDDMLGTLQSFFGGGQDANDILFHSWILLVSLVLQPPTSPRRTSRSGTSRVRTRDQSGSRRRPVRLWGEIYESQPNFSSVEGHELSDGRFVAQRRRVRRRLYPPR